MMITHICSIVVSREKYQINYSSSSYTDANVRDVCTKVVENLKY